ncbi:MAG: TetR/AcrR family transcriptional regulator [Bowdeniella nasicola]|nr:TetR/AcrR family transcriptional regulator [Bowdeniella nasicola]
MTLPSDNSNVTGVESDTLSTDADRRDIRSRENTRGRLLDAAAEVFATKGLAGATVEDLTRAAGFTRGAFYSNFSSKEEAFEAAVHHIVERIIATVDAADLSVREQDVFAAVGQLFQALRADLQVLHHIELEARLSALRRPDLRGAYGMVRQTLRRQVAALIERAVHAEGKTLTVDPEDLADSLIALHFNAVSGGILEGRDFAVARIGTTLVQAFSQA